MSEDRKEKIKNLGMDIEKDLILLGATAVEDALQINVKQTITRLIQADIKVWMITGDKLETAENIGLMAGIVTPEMKTFYISDVTKDNFLEKGKALNERVSQYSASGTKQIAVVFDMRSVGKQTQKLKKINRILDFIFSQPTLYVKESGLLASILMKADSVICARSTPNQKAEIVRFVRSRQKVCVAIGDGANDVNMITVKNYIWILFLSTCLTLCRKLIQGLDYTVKKDYKLSRVRILHCPILGKFQF